MEREPGVGQSGPDADGLCAFAGHQREQGALIMAQHEDSTYAACLQHEQSCVYPAPQGRYLCCPAAGKLSVAGGKEVFSHHQLQVSLLENATGFRCNPDF